MKTMTCKELGGPCDLPHRGITADDVIKAQDKHLKEVVAGGDHAHEDALKAMKARPLQIFPEPISPRQAVLGERVACAALALRMGVEGVARAILERGER